MTTSQSYPIGTPGQPWGAPEVAGWRSRQVKSRSYADDVVTAIDALRDRFDVSGYGVLDYAEGQYPLLAIRSREWRDGLPVLLVTGGVHGYETSGVEGALQFVRDHADDYAGRANGALVGSPGSCGRRCNWINSGLTGFPRAVKAHNGIRSFRCWSHIG